MEVKSLILELTSTVNSTEYANRLSTLRNRQTLCEDLPLHASTKNFGDSWQSHNDHTNHSNSKNFSESEIVYNNSRNEINSNKPKSSECDVAIQLENVKENIWRASCLHNEHSNFTNHTNFSDRGVS